MDWTSLIIISVVAIIILFLNMHGKKVREDALSSEKEKGLQSCIRKEMFENHSYLIFTDVDQGIDFAMTHDLNCKCNKEK